VTFEIGAWGTVALLTAAGIVVSFISEFAMSVAPRPVFHLFFAPGVIVHELSHLAAALACGHRVTDFCLYRSGAHGTGGYVCHEWADTGWVSDIECLAIGMAPLLSGMVAGYWLTWSLCNGHFVTLPQFGVVYCKIYWTAWVSFLKLVASGSFTTALIAYLFSSITASWLPSWQDLRNSIRGLVLVFVALAVFIALGGLLPRVAGLERIAVNLLWVVLLGHVATLSVSTLVFVLSAVWRLAGFGKDILEQSS